jgi:cytochrome c553
MATEVCVSCHGVAGRSEDSRFPRLAGQQAEYLENQLRNFKQHVRTEADAHDFMWGIAATLDDELITELAYYFQSQTAAPGKPGEAKLMALGNTIFHHGIPSRSIEACSFCHEAKAEGSGAFPRLAGQHSEYLLKQLQLIQSSGRHVPDMHDAIKDLNLEEMEAVAAYLHSI